MPAVSRRHDAIGFAAAALVATSDPGTLRLGGGLAAAWGETLLAAIRAALEVRVLPEVAAATTVERTDSRRRRGPGRALAARRNLEAPFTFSADRAKTHAGETVQGSSPGEGSQ